MISKILLVARVGVEVARQQHISAAGGCRHGGSHLVPQQQEVVIALWGAAQTILAAGGGQVGCSQEQGPLQAGAAVETEPEVMRRWYMVPSSLPQADCSAQAVMHKHCDATRRSPHCASAGVQPCAVPRNAGHGSGTRKVSLQNDDDVGVPTGAQDGGDFAEEAAATVPN